MLQPLDQHSADPRVAGTDYTHDVAYVKKTLQEFYSLRKPDEKDVDGYITIIVPGGHGPAVDLHQDDPSASCQESETCS